MKILPVGAELLHVDGRTDMPTLIFDSLNFLNVRRTAHVLIV
jgi:hypothetical protein